MPLRIAIPNKGRLNEDALRLLRAIGLKVRGAGSRTLMASAGGGRTQVLFARAQDIPAFVDTGACDLGITGLDLVAEYGQPVPKLLDLGFGRCRLIAAVPEASPIRTIEDLPPNARVATSFPRLAAAYFARRKRKVTVIPVSGAAEVTPAIGVADLIVDLMESGSTLRQNHLAMVDVLLDSEAVLIGGAGARRRRRAEVEEFVGAAKSVVEARSRRYLMANVPRRALAKVRAILPGISGPTVMNLLGRPGWVAIHAVTGEDRINGLIPRLRAVGAEGILVLPIERIVV
jgi:ATP phosphoribosyltransferase